MPSPVLLPIAPYAPDLPGFPAEAASQVRNCIPRTKGSWGPMPSPSVISSALGAQCQGMAAFLGSDGTVNLFAADATKLYRITGSGYTWADVSKVGGYGATVNTQWEFLYFNGRVLATDYNDNIQSFQLSGGSGLFTDLAAGSAPQAKHIAVIKNAFIMAGNTQDGVNGQLPQRVWWSAAGNATSWPTPGSTAAAQVQAGATDLLGDHGPVNSIQGELTSADGLVFQQDALKRVVYVGPPAIFDFLPAQNSRGTYSPWSPVVVGGICYFLGYDGFYSCDGATVSPMGADRVDKTFLDDLDPAYLTNVIGAFDPVRRMIWWAYPGSGNTSGVPNRVLGYSWQYDRWCILDVTCETIGRMYGTGYTLDQLYTILGYTIDTVPAPFDSPIWQGGTQVLGIFDSNHKMNFFTGSSMSPTVETQELELFPGKRAMITGGVRPLIDGTNTQMPSVALKHREVAEATPITTPYQTINSLGKANIRTSGRYIRASITIPAGGDWQNISGVEIDNVQQGSR